MHGRPVPGGDRQQPAQRLRAHGVCWSTRLCRRDRAGGRGTGGGGRAGQSAVVDADAAVLPYVNRISGAICVVVGLYVAYYGWFELRLFAGGSAAGSGDCGGGAGAASCGGLGVSAWGMAVAAGAGSLLVARRRAPRGRYGGARRRADPASGLAPLDSHGMRLSLRRCGGRRRRRTGSGRRCRPPSSPSRPSGDRPRRRLRQRRTPGHGQRLREPLRRDGALRGAAGRLRPDHPERQRLRGLERPLGQRRRLHVDRPDPTTKTPATSAGVFRLTGTTRCRSNRSLSITLTHAATKSLTNFSFASSSA